jgi:hypothetical protein
MTNDPAKRTSRLPKRRERGVCPGCGRYVIKRDMAHLPWAYLGGERVLGMRGKTVCGDCGLLADGPNNEDPIASIRRARGLE